MSTTTPQVSWDNRPVIAKRRRAELYGFLDHLGVPFPVGAPKDQMIELLKANGVDINQPHEYFKWRVVSSQDENGMVHQHVEAEHAPHETARVQAQGQAINYDKIIAERAAAVAAAEEKEEQIEAQDQMMTMILDKLAKLEANNLPLENMSPPQLKGIAKRRGLAIGGRKTKAELIELLEG